VDNGQYDYVQRMNPNFVNSQIFIDEYGNEVYRDNYYNYVGGNMSQNVPMSGQLLSDSKY
jgi:hypothetical protein